MTSGDHEHAGCTVSLGDLPDSASSMLRLQAWLAKPNFVLWLVGIVLGPQATWQTRCQTELTSQPQGLNTPSSKAKYGPQESFCELG